MRGLKGAGRVGRFAVKAAPAEVLPSTERVELLRDANCVRTVIGCS